MKFSVLVPVYNVEKYITKCLDSLLSQTFKDYEIILVDDGSTDSSGGICDLYAAKYPDVVRVFHKQNEGLLLTRRYSLRQAHGEYIVFVDSDDYVEKNLLEILSKTFDQYQIDMVIYNFKRFVDGCSNFSSPDIPYPDGTIFSGSSKQELYCRYLISHLFVNMWVKAVRRSCIDIDVDYSRWKINRGEDIIQSFALFDRCKSIIYIDKQLYYYRKNAGGVTTKVKPTDYFDFLKHYEISKCYLDRWKLPTDTAKQFYARQMGKFYFYLRNLKQKMKAVSDNSSFDKTVHGLIRDERFLDICNRYEADKVLSSYTLRMKIFRYAVLHQNAGMVKLIITASNFFGGSGNAKHS